jgi:hypothetical protein
MSLQLIPDSIVDFFEVLAKKKKVLAIFAMFVPLILTLIGLEVHAAVINSIVFGISVVRINIPKRVFRVKNTLTRILDFFWFTSVYVFFLTLSRHYSFSETNFPTFLSFGRYESEPSRILISLMMDFVIIMGVISIIALIFWQYNNILRGTEFSSGSAILVYFGLTVFTIFLGLGGTTLINIVIITFILWDLIQRKEERKIIESAGERKDSIWTHLLKASTNPRIAAYTMHLFVWGLLLEIFIAFLDLTKPAHILYFPLVLTILIMTMLFIVDDTPLRISIPIYSLILLIGFIVANLISPSTLFLDLLQSAYDSGVFSGSNPVNPNYTEQLYASYAADYGISVNQLMFGMFAHLLLVTYCGFFVTYGAAKAIMCIESPSKTDEVSGWLIVCGAYLLEPVLWFVTTYLSGIWTPSLAQMAETPSGIFIILSLSVLLLLAVPFSIEVHISKKRNLTTAWVGGNRYILCIVVLYLITLVGAAVWFLFCILPVVWTMAALFVGLEYVSIILIWFPLLWKTLKKY